jgi:adenylate cyclase
MNLVYPLVMSVLALMSGLGLRYLIEGRARRRVAALFAQYVPPAVAQRLVDDDRVDAAMEGERMEVSVLFVDLRGFTAQSAKMEPAQVRDMLDHYYLEFSKLILDRGGTLMQYVGDEIYAIFGAPVPMEDHAQRAFECAVAMQQMRPLIGEQLEAKGLPPIFCGVGLNMGTVVAAHVGNEFRRQYSAIGDTVNIGSRLCSQAREDQICMPEHMRAALVDPPEMEDLGPIEFKNATRPIPVWRLWLHRDEAPVGDATVTAG